MIYYGLIVVERVVLRLEQLQLLFVRRHEAIERVFLVLTNHAHHRVGGAR
jgi:hypothetical protein